MENTSTPTPKEEFITLLRNIKRPGAQIDALVEKLESSDFFSAPASTKYHSSVEGGLCVHCLNVYYNLMHLFKYKFGEELMWANADSIAIVALLHDMSKMNLYEIYYKNVKVYSPNGDKQDKGGKFYWDTQWEYKVKDANDRFIFGSHEATAEYMVRQFIPLKVEESVAIMHHMGGMGWDSAQDNLGEIYNKYSLSVLLHCADLMASYIDERCY